MQAIQVLPNRSLQTFSVWALHEGIVMLKQERAFANCCHKVGSTELSRMNLTNWLVGKVASYDGATLKVTEHFSKAIILPMFVYGDCMVVCLILYTSAMGVVEIAKSIHLTG